MVFKFEKYVMKTALLIIDIQNDYFKNGANPLVNSEEACNNAKFLLANFRKKKMPVTHIQHLALRPGSSFFLPDTVGAEIHPSLTPVKGEKVFIKHSPNSFKNTGLLEHFLNLDVKKIVVCGMMTHMCVDSTVRAAKDYGFEITLIGDACATKDLMINGELINSVNIHKSFLAALTYFYCQVLTTEQFLQLPE
jgi:nicotinamidase-related amidase